MNKKLLLLLSIYSTTVTASEWSVFKELEPYAKNNPPLITKPDYEWPDIINDDPKYVEPQLKPVTLQKCQFGYDILGGCKLKNQKGTQHDRKKVENIRGNSKRKSGT